MNPHNDKTEPDPQRYIDKSDIEYINNHWKRMNELWKIRGDDTNT